VRDRAAQLTRAEDRDGLHRAIFYWLSVFGFQPRA
jgi:hypothetical protein